MDLARQVSSGGGGEAGVRPSGSSSGSGPNSGFAGGNYRKFKSKRNPVNHEILEMWDRKKPTLLIGPDGANLGNVQLQDALHKAESFSLDLVQVNDNPLVCRIQDYGKESFRRQKDRSQGKSKKNTLKEIQVGIRINPHDLEIKLKRARKFLEEGHRVQFNLRIRGREIQHFSMGVELLKTIAANLVETHAKLENPMDTSNPRRTNILFAPRPGMKKTVKKVVPGKKKKSKDRKSELEEPVSGASLGDMVEKATTKDSPAE